MRGAAARAPRHDAGWPGARVGGRGSSLQGRGVGRHHRARVRRPAAGRRLRRGRPARRGSRGRGPRRSSAIAAGRSYVEDVGLGATWPGSSARAASRRRRIHRGLRRLRGDPHLPAHAARRAPRPGPGYVTAGAETAAANLARGALVVLESHHLPGHHPGGAGTRPRARRPDDRRRTSSSPSARSASTPATPRFGIRNTPKVVGGITAACTGARRRRSTAGICDTVHVVSSPESRRDVQDPREHLPRREHRARQRAGHPRRPHGHRRLGGHRRGVHEALRLHALLARARPRRALHPRRPLLPGLARQGLRPRHRVRGAGRPRQRRTCPTTRSSRIGRALNDRGKAVRDAPHPAPRHGLQGRRRRPAREPLAEAPRAAARRRRRA